MLFVHREDYFNKKKYQDLHIVRDFENYFDINVAIYFRKTSDRAELSRSRIA
jgi:hypothetical protein